MTKNEQITEKSINIDDFTVIDENAQNPYITEKQDDGKFYVNLNSNYNRAIVHTYFIKRYPIPVGIVYNKNNNLVLFQIDTLQRPIQQGEVKIRMFRKLEDSEFRKLYLSLERIHEGDKDYKYRLRGVKNNVSKDIIRIVDEYYSFNQKKDEENSINIYAWKFMDIDNDYVFLLVQRNFFNRVTRIHTIRSYAMEIYTDRGESTLQKYYESRQ